MHPVLSSFMTAKYRQFKAAYPAESRRNLQHRILAEFWTSKVVSTNTLQQIDSSGTNVSTDPDPFDAIVQNCLGVLIRTDFSDDEAWKSFSTKLAAGEAEIKEMNSASQPDSSVATEGEEKDVDMEDEDGSDNDNDSSSDNSDSDDEAPSLPSSIINTVDQQSIAEKVSLVNISNLTALQLVNDVDIRLAPFKHNSHSSPLIEYNGYQQVYTGPNVWLYDFQSNKDKSVRLVNQNSDDTVSGSATGDSWRIKVEHICEMQFNISVLGMKINFAGVDRWDYQERQRNMMETSTLKG